MPVCIVVLLNPDMYINNQQTCSVAETKLWFIHNGILFMCFSFQSSVRCRNLSLILRVSSVVV